MLDKEKIGKKAVFCVDGVIQKPVIVRRDVAESILRRSMLGINYDHVTVAGHSKGGNMAAVVA